MTQKTSSVADLGLSSKGFNAQFKTGLYILVPTKKASVTLDVG